MGLDQAIKKLKFDSRLVEQHLATGQITKEEYKQYLASLEDCREKSAPLQLEEEKQTSSSQH